jgi:hypothetical protein
VYLTLRRNLDPTTCRIVICRSLPTSKYSESGEGKPCVHKTRVNADQTFEAEGSAKDLPRIVLM